MSSPIEELWSFACAVFEQADDPFWALDREKRLVWANRAWLDSFALSIGMKAKPGDALIELIRPHFPKLAARWEQLYDRALAGGVITEDQEYELGGERRHFLVSLYPVRGRDGEITGISCLSKDITELKAALEEARHARSRFMRIFHSSPAPILVTEIETGRIVDANNAFAEMTGYPREELLGKTSLELGLWSDPGMRGHLVGEVKHEGRTGMVEVPFRKKSGQSGVALGAFVEAWIDGEHVMISVSEDITERKRWLARREQSSRLEAIGQLAAGVAHDFNNLLTVIICATDLLLEHPMSGEAQRHALTRIRGAAARAGQLTRQLLAFGRKQALIPQRIRPQEQIRQVSRMLERTLGENVELVFDLRPTPQILVDPTQFAQVLIDLSLNSRDAMPRGGRLRFHTRELMPGDPLLADVPLDRAVLVEVEDTGTGMTPEVRAHAFEPFFTTKPQGQATGLGLSTVYGIVRQSGGYARMQSAEGRGTTIRLFFPALPALQPQAEPASERQ